MTKLLAESNALKGSRWITLVLDNNNYIILGFYKGNGSFFVIGAVIVCRSLTAQSQQQLIGGAEMEGLE